MTNWTVFTRNGNYSAFNGGRFTRSAYSAVHCTACGAVWRTKAKYVNGLPDYERVEYKPLRHRRMFTPTPWRPGEEAAFVVVHGTYWRVDGEMLVNRVGGYHCKADRDYQTLVSTRWPEDPA